MSLLAQLATLKHRLGIEGDEDTLDPQLTPCLTQASRAIETFLGRKLERAAGSTFEFEADAINVFPVRTPIETGSVSAWDLKWDETDGWVAQTGVEYRERQFDDEVVFLEMVTELGGRLERGRVTYDGGYVLPGGTPSGAQVALPEDIEEACLIQAGFLYKSRNKIGVSSETAGDGARTVYQKRGLLPEVKELIMPFKRMVI